MLRKFFSVFRYYDWFLTINILLLLVFSLAILYSLQLNVARPNFTFFNRQLVFVILGLVLFWLISTVNFSVWSDYYKIIFFLTVVLLGAVLATGITIRGTTGWLEFFGQTLQPVELAKVALLIFLARFFSLKGQAVRFIKEIVFSGLASGLLIFLVILQPDFGSAALLLLIWLGLIFLLPLRPKILLGILAIILILALAGWSFFLADYQRDRLLTFLNPQADPLGAGYNVRQAVVAVGAGQLLGRGLGLGSQSQLNFLPEQQTDFIFAVIAEELGFLGAGLVVILFFILLLRIYLVAENSGDQFAYFFCLGLLILLLVQVLINLGMNLGLAPVTGIPLPLVSYGGSALLSMMLALGIVQSIQVRNRQTLFKPSNSLD